MSKIVLNKLTGLVHNVPDGHWSLTDPDYEIVEAVSEPETKPAAKPKTAVTKRKPRAKTSPVKK